MLRHALAAAVVAGALSGCDATEPSHPAIGTWDQVLTAGQAARTATCGTITVVNGALVIEDDRTFLKVDVGTTPGGSATCGYVGGTWARVDGTSLELTADPQAFPGFAPAVVTVQGDQLTFGPTGVAYSRRE